MIKSKLYLIFAVAIVFLLSTGAYYFYRKGSDQKQQEVTIQTQQTYIDTRKRIDEATTNNKSFDSAVDKLRSRQQERVSK